jgi:hypothetical protein
MGIGPATNLNPPTAKDQTDGVTPPPEPESEMAGIFDGEGDADGENNDAISVNADPRVPSSSAAVFYPSMPPEQQQPLLDMKVEAKK